MFTSISPCLSCAASPWAVRDSVWTGYAGVFHMKAYIVDDEMVLSGANLSEEYFDDRLDRYMLFANGGWGVVVFYAELCDALCGYAIRFGSGRVL